jgi:hypothetical protein
MTHKVYLSRRGTTENEQEKFIFSYVRNVNE